ncbi:hypothetical protein [Streptacidiphilus sp. MAP12-20]|uniref:hypothetical protein n=1 Tax=Streptacidiphilus sp. MAP12-20 TaxID=3156299 RepID=UPI003512514C
MSATLLLAACNGGSGSGSTGAPGASGNSTAGAAPSPTGGQTSGAVAAPTSTVGTVQDPSGQQSPSMDNLGNIVGCANRTATPAVKAAVTHAYAAATGHTHIQPRPGQFLYGQCKGVYYAATAFDLTPGATYEEKVAAQDDGSVRKYFILAGGNPWAMNGSASFPDTGGCFNLIPQQLSQEWNNCPATSH